MSLIRPIGPIRLISPIILTLKKMSDFDEMICRRGTNSVKWDETEDDGVLPMWVADMDFRTAPVVQEALERRVRHGIYGYVHVPGAYYDAVTGWFGRRHGWCMERGWIIYTSGVVPAISAVIKAVTEPGDKVLVQTPVYNCFFSSVRNNGCVLAENRLVYAENTYSIDFDDFERKAADPSVKVFLLCNPHNPVGRVWTADELRRMGEICMRHGVFVVSDEIHCELVMPGYEYTPFASLSEDFLMHSATCTSPSKAFNIAGLQIANITVADPKTRRKVDRAININEVCDVNPFGVEALMAAYTDRGGAWLAELTAYLHANYVFLKEYFAEKMPRLKVVTLEGTYLVWVDCSAIGKPSEVIVDELMKKHKLWLNSGNMYGECDRPFVRINIACPRARLAEGLRRFSNYEF